MDEAQNGQDTAERTVAVGVEQFMPPFELKMFRILGDKRFIQFMERRDQFGAQYSRGLITAEEYLGAQADLLAQIWLDYRKAGAIA